MLHILDRVVPSQEGVYASGRSICSASPATCQLLRGYLERLHSKHGVLLVQYLNYPLIRLLLSLLESGGDQPLRRSGYQRIPTAIACPTTTNARQCLVHGVLGRQAFVHLNEETDML